MTGEQPERTPGVDPDELSHGPEREPGRPRLRRPPNWIVWPWWLRVSLAAVTVVVGGTVLLGQRGEARLTAPSAAPSATFQEGPQPQYFDVGTICPAVTDRVHTLLLSFTLTNITTATVTVERVEPVLPLQGLRTVSIDIAGGTCDEHRGAPTALEVPAGTALLVTFRFLLPATCPKPLPVQVRVDVRSGSAVVTTVVPLYNDLGAVNFDTCPSAG